MLTIHSIRDLLERAIRVWSSTERIGTLSVIVLATLLWLALRRRDSTSSAALALRTDALYTALYMGGIYTFFIGGPLYRLQSRTFQWLFPHHSNLLAALPPWLQLVAVIVLIDLATYWWHRAAHRSSLLWAFHRIHHSQEELSPLTNFRFHLIDSAGRLFVQSTISLLLGAASLPFMLALWIETALNLLAHSGFSWSYGPIGNLLVSPSFHRLHHSRDPLQTRSNFAFIFSSWDSLFGTARQRDDRPLYGIDDPPPEGFFGQQFEPLFWLLRSVRPARVAGATQENGAPAQHHVADGGGAGGRVA